MGFLGTILHWWLLILFHFLLSQQESSLLQRSYCILHNPEINKSYQMQRLLELTQISQHAERIQPRLAWRKTEFPQNVTLSSAGMPLGGFCSLEAYTSMCNGILTVPTCVCALLRSQPLLIY